MTGIRQAERARVGPVQGLAFKLAEHSQPALEGFTHAHMCKEILEERKLGVGGGITKYLPRTVARLDRFSRRGEEWDYTRMHSWEVGVEAFIMVKEALAQGVPEANLVEPELLFVGGLGHDIGKTFLPDALMIKEAGIKVLEFKIFKKVIKVVIFEDRRLKDTERGIVQEGHIAGGTRYDRLFGKGDHIKVVLDMGGLHHVNWSGEDTCAQSYPSLLVGKNLPLYARFAKVADFVSAVLPRHYRQNGIQTLEDALAYAVSVGGMELDPVGVRCLMTGLYKVSPENADDLIARLRNPAGWEGISDFDRARAYAKDVVAKDPGFIEAVSERASEKISMYMRQISDYVGKMGIPVLDGLRILSN